MGWLVPALAALAVAATAAAVVLAIGRDDGARTVVAPPLTAATTAATALLRTTPPAVSTARHATTARPATTVATSTAATPTTTHPGLVAWPARAAGFTVVVASLPRAVGTAKAEARALEVARHGLPQAGVVVSDGFASLHPGYLVIFSGIYANLDAARSGAAAAQRLYPGAYPRRIAR